MGQAAKEGTVPRSATCSQPRLRGCCVEASGHALSPCRRAQPRSPWLEDCDLVEDPREVRVALDYDLKRMPVRVVESEGCLCIEATRPWRDRAEFRA